MKNNEYSDNIKLECMYFLNNLLWELFFKVRKLFFEDFQKFFKNYHKSLESFPKRLYNKTMENAYKRKGIEWIN